jgi:hypothetical protein
MELCIETNLGILKIINEPVYSFNSTGNSNSYRFEKNLAPDYKPSSIHGITLNDERIAVFGNAGYSGIYPNSAILIDGQLYFAIGNCVACISVSPYEFIWAVEVDISSCFGIYFQKEHDAFMAHGELEITRLSQGGKVIWSSSGADIFTEGLELLPHCIKVIDFSGKIYYLDYANGNDLNLNNS